MNKRKRYRMAKRELTANFLFSKRQALMSSLALSSIFCTILFICFFYLILRFAPTQSLKTSRLIEFLVIHFVSNVLLLYILYSFSNWLIKRWREKRRGGLRLMLGITLICCFLSPAFSQIQWLLLNVTSHETGFNFLLGFNLLNDLILAVMMLFETGIRHSAYRQHQMGIANEKLMKENIRTRYEALKNQLDPHFLFNSLNTLNGLIGIDNEKAQEYVQNLSSVLRYTLHSKSICTLSEELEFVDAYVQLLKIRFGESLTVNYAIDDELLKLYLMPVSLQLLVENAIKHNTISRKKPFSIQIETTENETILVRNQVNPKLKKTTEDSGLGLANLEKRYSILFNKSITVRNEENNFTVEIPLMKKSELKFENNEPHIINKASHEDSNSRRRGDCCPSFE